MNMKPYTKKIVLENGQEFYGYGFGADKEAICEIVFNTSMVGYQEIMSDPSYTDQMVVMTYPLIGNYGMTDEDYETKNPTIGGMIVREYNDSPSNFRYTKTLSEVFEEHAIPGIEGVDTRALTKMLRSQGSMNAMLTCAQQFDVGQVLERLHAYKVRDTIQKVTRSAPEEFPAIGEERYHVAMMDYGVKQNMIDCLRRRGCSVTALPASTPAETVLSGGYDGVLLSSNSW